MSAPNIQNLLISVPINIQLKAYNAIDALSSDEVAALEKIRNASDNVFFSAECGLRVVNDYIFLVKEQGASEDDLTSASALLGLLNDLVRATYDIQGKAAHCLLLDSNTALQQGAKQIRRKEAAA